MLERCVIYSKVTQTAKIISDDRLAAEVKRKLFETVLPRAVCNEYTTAPLGREDRAPEWCRVGGALLGGQHPHRPHATHSRSVVVQNRAGAAALGEQRVRTVAEQVEVEVLVGLLPAVPLHFDGDGLRRLAGGEGRRAGLSDLVSAGCSGSGDDQPGRVGRGSELRTHHADLAVAVLGKHAEIVQVVSVVLGYGTARDRENSRGVVV